MPPSAKAFFPYCGWRHLNPLFTIPFKHFQQVNTTLWLPSKIFSSISCFLHQPSHRIWYKKNWAHPELSNLNPSASLFDHISHVPGSKVTFFFGEWCSPLSVTVVLRMDVWTPRMQFMTIRCNKQFWALAQFCLFFPKFLPSVQTQFAGRNKSGKWWRGKWESRSRLDI